MKKFFPYSLIVLSIVMFVIIAGSGNEPEDKNEITQYSQSNNDLSIFEERNEWTESKLKSMSLREKIGQMIITYSDGYSFIRRVGIFCI